MSDVAAADGLRTFAAAVSSILAPDQIRTVDLDRFAIDGLQPSTVVLPRDIVQLQSCLREAQNSRATVIPWGGGAHMALGNAPAAYDVALSLDAMRRVVAYEAADMTVTIEAGMPLPTLQATLRTQRQFLPLDPAGGEAATVGGVLSANAQGPLRHAFGTARDWLIGLTVVQADGTIVRSGGRVVKNVAGYDMSKLYVGSLGTLGVIAEATFKLAPLPAAEQTIAVACDSAHAASVLLFAAHDAGLAMHAAELLSPAAAQGIVGTRRWTALVRAAGGARAVERTVRELTEVAGGLQAAVSECNGETPWVLWRERCAAAVLSLRVSVLPSAVADVAEALDAENEGALVSSTVSAGLVRVRCDGLDDRGEREAIARAWGIAEKHDGTVVIEAASSAVKRGIDVFGATGERADFAIMRRLKAELDPRGTLARGRFIGRV
jgi:glycolate oxidase FAD binding subunit